MTALAEPTATRTGGAALSASGLTVAYGARTILADVSLTVGRGERVAIVGPNGAGKSTLLRALTGGLAPRAGAVEIDGQAASTLDRKALARLIAVVPELVAIPFQMTVDEVVSLGRLPHDPPFSGPRPTDRAAVEAAIERVGVGPLRARDARELSVGERQLVFIALAIAQGGSVLVLDEPTAHLDIRHQVEVMRLLVDINERDGTTVIAVLHDLALAAHFFPRIVVVDEGRIVADGPPATTLDDEHIRRVFGVDPALVRLPVGGLAGDA